MADHHRTAMRISFIGSGNVATHLAAAFRNAGHVIVEVCSRREEHAAMLAYHVGAMPVLSAKNLRADVDLLVLAVSDDAIPDLAAEIADGAYTVVHTSGSVPLWVLEKFNSHGVFYPLQTFSKDIEVNMREVPVCIEAGSDDAYFIIRKLAAEISGDVQHINSAQRRVLHLSAVFACNFVNHLYGVGQQLLAQNELNFALLRPLIRQTAEKVMKALPAEVQTGPAARNDVHTMQNHLDILHDQESLAALYRLMSRGILDDGEQR